MPRILNWSGRTCWRMPSASARRGVTCSYACTPTGREVTSRWRTTGPGIPQAELAHIFERFHRGDSSRARDTGGYGLGLAISKALIEAYGGTITPESEAGQGTRMVVEIPLEREN